MNRRKAGEDFYFLHKIIPLGHYYEINSTCVRPSPRSSDRVPFGTGAAVDKILSSKDKVYPVFHPQAFYDLKIFFNRAGLLFRATETRVEDFLNILPGSFRLYLEKKDFITVIDNINRNSSEENTFLKRFYTWFNGLQVLQYLNEAHESVYEKIPVKEAVRELLQKTSGTEVSGSERELLLMMRDIQRMGVGS